jgi:hypothetical protein
MEILKLKINEEIEKENELGAEEKRIVAVLLDIKRSFYDCCLKLEEADDGKIPDWSNDTTNLQEILHLLKRKYLAALQTTEVSTIAEEYLSPKIEERVTIISYGLN